MAAHRRQPDQQLQLFDDLTVEAGATKTVAPTVESSRGTVSFVGPDGYAVPVDALQRIVRLMIDQARHSPDVEAS